MGAVYGFNKNLAARWVELKFLAKKRNVFLGTGLELSKCCNILLSVSERRPPRFYCSLRTQQTQNRMKQQRFGNEELSVVINTLIEGH